MFWVSFMHTCIVFLYLHLFSVLEHVSHERCSRNLLIIISSSCIKLCVRRGEQMRGLILCMDSIISKRERNDGLCMPYQ